jgi:hypothetical protein
MPKGIKFTQNLTQFPFKTFLSKFGNFFKSKPCLEFKYPLI